MSIFYRKIDTNIREYTQNKMNSDKIEAIENKFSLSHKLLLFFFFSENLSFTIIQNKVFLFQLETLPVSLGLSLL